MLLMLRSCQTVRLKARATPEDRSLLEKSSRTNWLMLDLTTSIGPCFPVLCRPKRWERRNSRTMCTYTHTHTFLHFAQTHACQRGSLHVCRFSPSRLLQSHVSHIFCCLRTTTLSISTFPSTLSCRTYLSWKRRACVAPHEDEKFGYLAKSALNTGYEPNEFDKITSVDSDTQTSMKSLTSRITHTRTLDCSVFSHSLNPLFRTFLMMILLFNLKAKKACIGKPIARQRERKRERVERGGSVISVVKSMSKKNRRNNIRSHSLQTHREFYSDERDLREHLERRAQQAAIGEKSVQRKLYSIEYNMEIQNSERRHAGYALFKSQRELEPQRRQLLKANQRVDKLNEREYICVAKWRWRIIFIKNAVQEVAKKLEDF